MKSTSPGWIAPRRRCAAALARTAVSAALIVLVSPGLGRAQVAETVEATAVDAGRLAVMPSASLDPSTRPLAAALDPVVLQQLEAVAGVKAAARPALDLPAMELAVDCVGETPQCLRAVIAQSATDSLLALTVQRAGEETLVTALYFDARGAGEMRTVVRRHSGPDVQTAALDAVPGMLRELFAIPEPASEPEPGASEEQTPIDDSAIDPAREPVDRPFPVGPVVLGAAGVVLIGVGTAFGLAAKASEDEYRDANPTRKAEVDAAEDKLDTGETQALLCNVGVGVGAAAVAGSVVWLVIALSDDGGQEHAGADAAERTRLSVAPRIAPGSIGVTLTGGL